MTPRQKAEYISALVHSIERTILARVDAMPPMVAFAPGSIGKNNPWSRRYSLSCSRRTPASTTPAGLPTPGALDTTGIRETFHAVCCQHGMTISIVDSLHGAKGAA